MNGFGRFGIWMTLASNQLNSYLCGIVRVFLIGIYSFLQKNL